MKLLPFSVPKTTLILPHQLFLVNINKNRANAQALESRLSGTHLPWYYGALRAARRARALREEHLRSAHSARRAYELRGCAQSAR